MSMTTLVDALSRRDLLTAGLAVSIATLAGCAGSGSDSAPSPSATAHTVTDFLGETTIPSQPQRVIADSVSIYAHLFALGITPVAAALPGGISTSYFAPKNDPIVNVVADDGWTIDLEKALALDPDLVVAVGADYNTDNCQRYRAAAPTYCFEEGYRDTDEVKRNFLALGAALGRSDQALDAINAYDTKVAEAKQRLAPKLGEIGLVGVVRFDSGGFIGIRRDDIHNAVFDSLGLAEPEWPPAGESGYTELSLETLEVLNAAQTLFVTTDDDVDVDATKVFRSKIWRQVKPVATERAFFVGAWNGSDLPQLNRMVDDVVAAVG